MNNVILNTDSYKVTHYKYHKPGTTNMYSYLEARDASEYGAVMFFGLQYILKKNLVGSVVTEEKIQEAENFFYSHFGANVFNRAGWEYILKKHDGKLPIRIKAVPEGLLVPKSNVLLTVENTDPACFWLTNYLETLLMQVWYPTTVASLSKFMQQAWRAAFNDTVDCLNNDVSFRVHDFGFRGSTSCESAAIGGAAHLINFKGTDTLAACSLLKQYYHEDMGGYSIPATEHSVITSWGKENEAEVYKHILQTNEAGLVAIVSDSYDLYNAVENILGGELRELVLNRNGCLVIRPDSGDPKEVLCKLFAIMGLKFGYTTNSKGYKVLNSHVRVIWGYGINRHSLVPILAAIVTEGWSAENLTVGSGGGLLQQVNRDTIAAAIKCSSAVINGVRQDVYKEPKTDSAKNSKRGRLKLVIKDNAYATVQEHEEGDDIMSTVFENGRLVKDYTFAEIRELAGAQ